MKIIFYFPNSFGGNFNYLEALATKYVELFPEISVQVILPQNAVMTKIATKNILLADIAPYSHRILKKLYFLYRSFVNPLRFARYLRGQGEAIVVFNDYDQLTSVFWAPIFKKLRPTVKFAVILHDPDRDAYLPGRWMSQFTMKKVMSIMDLAFYHDVLPDRSYYRNFSKLIAIPHGIYDGAKPDPILLAEITVRFTTGRILGILGNIRNEKNYMLIFEAMTQLPEYSLLIAGAPANSDVIVKKFVEQTKVLGIESQVLIIDRYLTDSELAACITATDIVLLYYQTTFTSQSGILNSIAPWRKKILVSKTPSALAKIVETKQLGLLVEPDNVNEFVKGVRSLANVKQNAFAGNWDLYEAEHSWTNSAKIGYKHFKLLQNDN